MDSQLLSSTLVDLQFQGRVDAVRSAKKPGNQLEILGSLSKGGISSEGNIICLIDGIEFGSS